MTLELRWLHQELINLYYPATGYSVLQLVNQILL